MSKRCERYLKRRQIDLLFLEHDSDIDSIIEMIKRGTRKPFTVTMTKTPGIELQLPIAEKKVEREALIRPIERSTLKRILRKALVEQQLLR